jgi:anthranilate phosphoribosyltransferase
MVRGLPLLIKHVGRGARLAKDLPREEARLMMTALLAGEASPVQIGGFLMAMRMKSESPEELAGFVEAMRATSVPFEAAEDPRPLVDVDLHADGREGRPSLALAAACLCAAAGARVLLRSVFASRFARHDLGAVFAQLGVPPDKGLAASRRGLAGPGVAISDLADLLPRAIELLALREQLGVRTCINTTVKLLDPARSRRLALGIFHGPYHAPVGGAARALGAIRAAVVQAAGGVPELAPDKPTKVSRVEGDTLIDAEPLGPNIEGVPYPLAAPPQVDSAAALAELNERVLTAPAEAPSGAVRMALFTASNWLWVAGLGEAPLAALPRLIDLLQAGAGARTLQALRSSYTS